MDKLPIEPVLPQVLAALKTHGRCVLQAPPGAGKTTRVPLYLLEQGLCAGRILMLEPRRVAARAAAERLAAGLGEAVGAQVGYRMRGASVAGARIEVVTEGILTRMIQTDPGLAGVDCIIFDEFHERSLQADLGLALAIELRAALRPDLNILVMSATLDAGPVAQLLDAAPMVTAAGRSFEVETIWLERPTGTLRPREYALAVAGLVTDALTATAGGILVFLPGKGEIARVQGQLRASVPKGCEVMPLHGSMPFKAQRAAIEPKPGVRKIVLATAIAETSVTITDIATVIDGGRARRARFDAARGMSQLITERVTKAEAEQRRGRAGRVGEGTCYRLWTKGEEGGFAPFPPPEISAADLAPLVLELALWGARDPGQLAFLTPPPEQAFGEAATLLRALGALDEAGAITPHGRAVAAVPAHPRLAHMILAGGGPVAVDMAALLEARDILRNGTDMRTRLAALKGGGNGVDPGARAAVIDTRARLRRTKTADRGLSPGALLSLAFPDRIAQRRAGPAPRYLLSGGTGAWLEEGDPLGNAPLLVAADLDGDRREARIRLALPVTIDELHSLHGSQIERRTLCEWDRREARVATREVAMLGAIALEDRPWPNAPPETIAQAMTEGVRLLGLGALPFNKTTEALRARAQWLRQHGGALPDLSDAALERSLEDWLTPLLGRCRSASDLARVDLHGALLGMLDWPARQLLDSAAPEAIEAPTGTRLAIDYAGATPSISVRLQEMFGLSTHPTIGPQKTPLLIHLLSPARRPVQSTSDLPGFWQNSYADVRKDMRGRYPKHPWPEAPATAMPTRKAKPRA